MKKKIHVYCDTSVFGGIKDDKFSTASNRFFNLIREKEFTLVISPVVGREINQPETPQEIIQTYNSLLPLCEIVEINREIIELQQAYITEKIISSKWEDDALHVAAATVFGCELIVSWNFKHIVNYRRIPLYNAVNTLHGYGEIAIFSPLEVIENE